MRARGSADKRIAAAAAAGPAGIECGAFGGVTHPQIKTSAVLHYLSSSLGEGRRMRGKGGEGPRDRGREDTSASANPFRLVHSADPTERERHYTTLLFKTAPRAAFKGVIRDRFSGSLRLL